MNYYLPLPDSQKVGVRYGGHACNVTDAKRLMLCYSSGLASLLHITVKPPVKLL